MAIEQLSEDQVREWSAEQKDRWWLENIFRGDMPQLNVKNPKYALAIQAWRRLPLWATKLIGPRLAKSIP